LATLKLLHSRGGDEEPTRIGIGDYTFYYYGRGRGEVSYPDEYFYDLDGCILEIRFDRPYPATDNSTSAQTKEMETRVLKSFHRLQPLPSSNCLESRYHEISQSR